MRRTGGGDWTFIDEGLPAAGGSSVFALLTDSVRPGVFYAVNNIGIYISEDAGISFEKVDVEWPDEVLESRVLDAVLVK